MSSDGKIRIRILLFKGRGVISRLIRWQTWSKYSHVAVEIGEGGCYIESWPGKGVHQYSRLPHGTEGIDAFDVDISQRSASEIVNFLFKQKGRGYDYLGIIRFIPFLRWVSVQTDRWFCSDLVAGAFEFAGVPLLRDVPYYKISPGRLAESPLLK